MATPYPPPRVPGAAPPANATGATTIDLNYRLLCNDCKRIPPNIEEDYSNGDLVCGDCGLVFRMPIIDTHSEWRTFSNENAGDDPSRVGAAENPLLEGVGDHLSTVISGRDGHTGASYQLNKAHGKVSGTQKGDRNLLNSFKIISTMSDRIGLPKVVSDRAKHLYKKVFDEEAARGKSNEGIIAACIFIACRQEKVPRTFKEITTLTRVDKKTIGSCFKAIKPLIADTVYTASTEDYLARFCSMLDLDMSIRNAAATMVKNAESLGILAGKSPLSVAAAAIFMISQLSSTPKSQRDISPVAGVSEVTIKNAYKDLWIRRKEVVPKDFKGFARVEALPAGF